MAKILAISAHPDDEIFGAGYLAKLAAEGNDLYMLCTTRGEGGEVGEPPVGPKSRLGEFREVEMRAPRRALGARDVWFLDFIDPWMEIGGEALAIDADPAAFCAALAERIGAPAARHRHHPRLERRIRPPAARLHPPGGPMAALGTLAPWHPSELLTWCANDGNATTTASSTGTTRPTSCSDISPWFDRKLARRPGAHVSQHAMFLRNNKTDRPWGQAIRQHEAFHRWPLGSVPVRRRRRAAGRPRGRHVALSECARNDSLWVPLLRADRSA